MTAGVRGRALAIVLTLASTTAGAVQPDEILPDRALESRARVISAGMRCVVCQNQSIDDSDAPLARDLRLLVRDRLKAGDTDTAVRDYVAARYGAFVLLKPPLSAETILLWFGPGSLALLAAAGLIWSRRRAQPAKVAALSSDEQVRLAAVLGEGRV